MKLTTRICNQATYEGDGSSRYIVWDDRISGFGLRVYPTGRKSFVLRYRLRGERRQRWTVLGHYGVVTAEQARGLARQWLQDARTGEDPGARAAAPDDGPVATMADLYERYHREWASRRKKPSSADMDALLWRTHLAPTLGHRRVESLERGDVEAIHGAMHDRPVSANRVRSLLSKMLNLAEEWGMRPRGSNPATLIRPYREQRRERYLDHDELARLGATLDRALADGTEDPYAVAAIRLLLLTGARRSEILRLTWAEVDLDRGVLRLSDSKTGRSTRFLPPQAVDLLRSLPRTPENLHVIPGRVAGAHRADLKGPWRRISKAAGIPDVRLHDLRHTYASVAISAGLSLPVVGKLLGHARARTTDRYAHLLDSAQREASGLIGSVIEQAMGPDGKATVTERP